MLASGESQKKTIRPDFNRAIMIDFQGVQISSDTGFILLIAMDERFSIIDPMGDCLKDLRSTTYTKHSLTLFRLRWPEGFRCPRCQNGEAYFQRTRQLYHCKACGYQASLTTGTVFQKVRK